MSPDRDLLAELSMLRRRPPFPEIPRSQLQIGDRVLVTTPFGRVLISTHTPTSVYPEISRLYLIERREES